jgi:hypothetical protein
MVLLSSPHYYNMVIFCNVQEWVEIQRRGASERVCALGSARVVERCWEMRVLMRPWSCVRAPGRYTWGMCTSWDRVFC